MTAPRVFLSIFCFGLVTALCFTCAESISTAADALREGQRVHLGDRSANLTKLQTLPYITNEYTARFRYDRFENPKLQELRRRYSLDEIVQPGRDEFEKQILLNDWTHRQFKRFGHPSTNCHGGLEILHAISAGETFFCSQYAQVLVSAAASLGWVDRPLALRRHKGVNANGGSTEHTTTEIWSNQHGKWVMLDPTSNIYLEKDAVPLSAYEIRQEWFYHQGQRLTFVVGRQQKRYRKADLPVYLESFAGFGTLSIDPDELDKYGFTGYVPNTDLMDSGFDYGKMFIFKDRLCDGTKWHIRPLPTDPERECNFPIGQAHLTLREAGSAIQVTVQTLTPNFDRFEARFDTASWARCSNEFVWKLQPGTNRLEVRTVNKFGITGPGALAEFQLP